MTEESGSARDRRAPSGSASGTSSGSAPEPASASEEVKEEAQEGVEEAEEEAAQEEATGYGRTLAERMARRIVINVPDRRNARLREMIARVNADDELYALWLATNVNAIERLGMTDHGPVHVKIVMNIAVKLMRLLLDRGIEPGVVANYGMTREDAIVVVAAASLLHDVGMSIHRSGHEEFSLFVAQTKLRELLDGIYDVAAATIIRAEVLHAIIAHRSGGKPLTLEAGLVRVADALDMAKGRSRIPFESGSMSIHSVSASAIEAVTIEAGDEKPIRLRVSMSGSAGLFQIDQLFREKLKGSGLEGYVELEAVLTSEGERSLFREYRL